MTVHTWEQAGFRSVERLRSSRVAHLVKVDPAVAVEIAAGCSMVAALIHAFAAPGHLEEWIGYGMLFIAAAVAQCVLALALLGAPRRAVLIAGIAGNLALIGLWAMTRTSGIPIGPEAGEIEPVGVLDAVSKMAELAVVVLLATMLKNAPPARRPAAAQRLVAVGVLAIAMLSATTAGAMVPAAMTDAVTDVSPPNDPEVPSVDAAGDDQAMDEEEMEHPDADCSAPIGHPVVVPTAAPGVAAAVFVADEAAIVMLDVARNVASAVTTLPRNCWFGDVRLGSGEQLYFSDGYRLWGQDLQSGALRTVVASEDAYVSDFDVSPDGLLVATILENNEDEGSTLLMSPRTGGHAVPIHSFVEPQLGMCGGWGEHVVFSPDGTMLAVQRMPGDTTVSILRLDGSEVRPTFDGADPVWLPDSSGLAYQRPAKDGAEWARIELASGAVTPLGAKGTENLASVSPDGWTLAVSGYSLTGTDLIDLRSGTHKRLTDDFGDPIWLDASTIAATKQLECDGCDGWMEGGYVSALDLNGSEVRRLNLTRTHGGDTLIAPATPTRTDTSAATHAPILLARGEHTVTVLQRLTFTLSADDADGDMMTFTADGLPRHATFDPATKTFSWRPRPGQEGTWIVTFGVTDATGARDTARVRIVVRTIEEHLECALLATCGDDGTLAAVPPHASDRSAGAGRAEATP
jgi:hypothetical protein